MSLVWFLVGIICCVISSTNENTGTSTSKPSETTTTTTATAPTADTTQEGHSVGGGAHQLKNTATESTTTESATTSESIGDRKSLHDSDVRSVIDGNKEMSNQIQALSNAINTIVQRCDDDLTKRDKSRIKSLLKPAVNELHINSIPINNNKKKPKKIKQHKRWYLISEHFILISLCGVLLILLLVGLVLVCCLKQTAMEDTSDTGTTATANK
mmetsp:Transcript_83365/g.102146  ORF Transcript_83365/g.102146 Transcript_83365/m.102146 type:complete len:213 (-) Transcript_83365:149-787(-)